jgi:tetratricopeptide (TPR) repeat protein
MFKRAAILAAALCAACFSLGAETGSSRLSELSLSLTPAFSLPLGDDAAVFGLGGGGELSARYRPPFFPLVTLGGVVGYELGTLRVSQTISTLSIGAEAGLLWEPLPWLGLHAAARGGYFHSLLNNGGGGGGAGFVTGAAGAELLVVPSIGITAEAGYRWMAGFSGSLIGSLGVAYHFAPPISIEEQLKMVPKPLKGVRLEGISFDDIFPVFYKYYDTHPIGSARLANTESSPIQDVKVSVFVQQYMANPKLCAAPQRLKPGERAEVTLLGLFTDAVLGISESTKVSAQVVVEGTMDGRNFRNEYVETLRLYDRNAITWDDDRKAAAFVTLKDPTTLKFAKNISSIVKGKAPAALNQKLMTAVALHEALALYGMSYVVDPNSSYADFSKRKTAVDYVQFPRQTLEYKAGDCDDLSVLYCALLESTGISTAFITVPGHIFMAIALDLTPEEAKAQLSVRDDLIFEGNAAWLPIEVTNIDGGFLKAWELGAREWKEAGRTRDAKLFPLRDAWAVYEPVGFSGQEAAITPPPEDRFSAAFQQEVLRYVAREVGPREARLKEDMRASGGKPEAANRLGVLYARYGMSEKAEGIFRGIIAKTEYAPALVNLANLLLAAERAGEALELYQRALRKNPKSAPALLGMALASTRLERFDQAQQQYARLKQADPALAEKYAFLEAGDADTARAAEAAAREVGQWVEE